MDPKPEPKCGPCVGGGGVVIRAVLPPPPRRRRRQRRRVHRYVYGVADNTAEKRARVALRCLGLSQHFDEAGGVCPRPFLLHTHSFIHVYDATLIGSFARSNAFKQGGSTEVMIRLCVINVITFTVQVCSGERLETYGLRRRRRRRRLQYMHACVCVCEWYSRPKKWVCVCV